jgi:exodeoxyribonuclease V alpha subunit
MKGHPVFIAQHATATCCRGCLEKWHKIMQGKELNQRQQDYVVKVIMTWINNQMKP